VLGYWARRRLPPVMQLCHHLHGGMGMDIAYRMDRYYSTIKDLARLTRRPVTPSGPGGSTMYIELTARAETAASRKLRGVLFECSSPAKRQKRRMCADRHSVNGLNQRWGFGRDRRPSSASVGPRSSAPHGWAHRTVESSSTIGAPCRRCPARGHAPDASPTLPGLTTDLHRRRSSCRDPRGSGEVHPCCVSASSNRARAADSRPGIAPHHRGSGPR